MTAPEPLTGLSQDSPISQRRRTAANAAVESPTSKKTPRATRTANKTTRLEVNGVEDKDTFGSPAKRKKVKTVTTEEVPPALPKGAIPKKTKQVKEVKQETEDTQEQELQVKENSAKAKRTGKAEEDQKPADPQIDGDTLQTVKRKRVFKVEEEEEEIEVSELSPKKTKRKKAPKVKVDGTVDNESSPTKVRRKNKVDEEVQEGEDDPKKTKRKRKTKEEKEQEAMPIAARTDGLRMFIGAHVSGAKGWSFSTYIATIELRLCTNLGVQNSVTNCVHIGYMASKSHPKDVADMVLAEMPLPCSSNHRKNGRTLLCKTNIEINSYRYAVSTSTTQQGMKLLLGFKVDSIKLTHHSIQPYSASRLLSRQSRPRRHRKGDPSLQCLPGRSQPLRIPRHQTL